MVNAVFFIPYLIGQHISIVVGVATGHGSLWENQKVVVSINSSREFKACYVCAFTRFGVKSQNASSGRKNFFVNSIISLQILARPSAFSDTILQNVH